MILGPLQRATIRRVHKVRHRWRRWRGIRLEGSSMIARDLENKILLVRHAYGPAGWFFPGGSVKRGETPVAAAARELHEETGCVCDGVFQVGTFEEEVSGCAHTAHVVTCVTHDVPRPDGREVVEARFFPTHSLPEPLSPFTKRRIAFWQDPKNAIRNP